MWRNLAARQSSADRGHVIRRDLAPVAVLQHVEFKNDNAESFCLFSTRASSPRPCVYYQSPLHTAAAATSLPFFCLIHMAVTPSIGSPAIDKFIFSQAPFLLSAINLPPHLSILQYSLASAPLLRPPPPHQSPLWQVPSLPLSISAIFLLSIERSYFIGSVVHEDTTLRPVTLKSGYDLNPAVWWSWEITERHI